MSSIAATQRKSIEEIVGTDRARFDKRERRIYSHDTGVLPKAFRVLAGSSLADGVAQPETEDQLVRLVRYAAAHRIPVVPGGKASSGYGGAVVDNVMPKLLPEVAPKYVPVLFEHLRH